MISYLCVMDYRLMQRQARIREMCGKYVYPWLKSLADENKRKQDFPLFLSDYYSDPKDKEVAEAVALLLPLGENREKYIIELRNILGDSPRDMVEKRAFFHLANRRGILRAPTLNGNYIINALDWTWETCVKDRIPLEYAVLGELGIINRQHTTPMSSVYPESNAVQKMEFILNKMTMIDGLWHFMEIDNLPCPLTAETMRILKVYYPIENGVTCDNINSIIRFFGFERPVDFMFCVWEYEKLRKREKDKISAFELSIGKWYKKGAMKPDIKPPVKLKNRPVRHE